MHPFGLAAGAIMSRLAGKVIIVSGGTRGIGEATVRGLVREGAKVVFGGRSRSAGEAIEGALGADAAYVEQDVGLEAHWERIVAIAVDRFGKLTGLISNAGASVFCPLEGI